jgi:LmbE family N-acetylglucosaminyl deacetylase
MPGLLALLAHPDDEIFCAGLLAAVTARGVPVHLAYWTRGEGGASPRRRALWRCLPRAWHPRVGEARRSAALLGVASVTFLDAIDPAPDPEQRAPSQEARVFLAKLVGEIERHRPEILLTHGSQGDYGHPAHRRLHQLARAASGNFPDCTLLSFNASWPGAPAVPYFRQKIGVMRAHSSQKQAFTAMARGGGIRALLRLGRYESYHCWSTGERRDSNLKKLELWTSAPVV